MTQEFRLVRVFPILNPVAVTSTLKRLFPLSW